jgi:hypothetical protein
MSEDNNSRSNSEEQIYVPQLNIWRARISEYEFPEISLPTLT